jgi:anti-sigma regulatory factor (Ser/Thr protein kinase)
LSQAGEARRLCATLCSQLSLDETCAGRAAIVATELATNMVKHANGGRLLLQPVACEDLRGLELLALDTGPGMGEPARGLRNGYSTSGSPGIGLGAVQRLSSEFDLFSVPGAGTAIMSRLWANVPVGARRTPAPFITGAVCLPRIEAEPCGDAWAVAGFPGRLVVLVADGLGHGPDAAVAAETAASLFRKQAANSTQVIVEAIHAGLRTTRGAAVAVADVDAAQKVVHYTGIGNISASIYNAGAPCHLVSHHGTAGGQAHKIQEFTYPWPAGSLLVMHSDGLATHWNLDRYLALAARHPSLVAGVLYRDFNRGRDDVTALAVKERAFP